MRMCFWMLDIIKYFVTLVENCNELMMYRFAVKQPTYQDTIHLEIFFFVIFAPDFLTLTLSCSHPLASDHSLQSIFVVAHSSKKRFVFIAKYDACSFKVCPILNAKLLYFMYSEREGENENEKSYSLLSQRSHITRCI